MTKFLISFPSSTIDRIPAEDFPAVSEVVHAVVGESKMAGVWVFGGGINEQAQPMLVSMVIQCTGSSKAVRFMH